MKNCGNPPPQCTSTRTSGASRPNCARVSAVASVTGRSLRPLQRGDAFFEVFEPLAASAQHRGLDVEFLARHEVEFREAALQDRLEVLLEVVAERGEARRHGFRQLARELVEGFRVEGQVSAP